MWNIISQSCIYVGFILQRNRKERHPKSERCRSFLPHACGMCLRRVTSSRVAPLRCSLRFHPTKVNTCPFPISGAKVQHLFDICKFYVHKMKKYVVKHKKGAFLPLFYTTILHTIMHRNQSGIDWRCIHSMLWDQHTAPRTTNHNRCSLQQTRR